ncbi:outer membrane insertion C-terminal signal [Xylanibacter ruminicola]|jgi:outer membrane protein OmpA-like peptidoglycan-associated protein|uniref:Outer membrane insertion C-terminal signal n=2 Tax=Bacteroidales TaxID=171549 RepID=A0A1H5RKK5_XYLRU|nr:outer membrane insertion C-terminal signal [Xylanibacter ruminicola]SEW08394.1 outer membrane insertion C-terminal signal [Prevotella sp. khp7]
MKMKKAILSCLMLMAGLSVSAQEQKGTTEYVFEPHWYVQLQAGGQYTTGEAKFGDLISPNVQVGVGYQFSKALGARFAVNAWQGKAGYSKEATDKLGFGDLNYKFNYFAPSIDLTFDLSNIIAGFNPNRVVSFGAFIGGGVNFRSTSDEAEQTRNLIKFTSTDWTPMFENKSAVLPFAQAGLTVDFKVSDAVKLGAELNGNILGDKFNFKDAGNPDSYINLLVGAKIALGKTYSTKFIPAPEPEIKYVEKIVEKIVEVPAAAPAAAEPLRRDIFFQINKTIIRESEAQKVQDIVAYMNQNPTSKVMITGYADAGTGNDKINDRLAAGRADAVVKALKAAGIAESRISYDSKGARVQPFEDNDSNRVSICIAE